MFRTKMPSVLAPCLIVVAAGALCFSTVTGATSNAVSTDPATLEDIAERYGLEIWGEGDLGTLAGLIAEDVIDHNAFPGQAPGREGMGDILVAFRAAFPDLTLTNNDIVVGSDRVVLRWTAVGTHEGALMGIPATGAVVTMTGIDILRVENGLVVERWGEYNGLQLMQQIGAIDS